MSEFSLYTVVYFDLECAMCSKMIRMIAKFDHDDLLRFKGIKGTEEEPLLSIRVEKMGRVYESSDACLEIAKTMGGAFALSAQGLILLPKYWRDKVYRFVAQHRKMFFKLSACTISGDDEVKRRLLD